MKTPIDLTSPSAGIAIVTCLDVICLFAIILCYVLHADPALIKFLDGAFTGFNGALLMAVRVSRDTMHSTDTTQTTVLTNTTPVEPKE